MTGRLYCPGPVSIRKAPSSEDKGTYADYYEKARRAYEDEAGVTFPTPAERSLIIIQDVIPIAQSRPVDTFMQSIKIPTLHFDALVAPRLGYFADDKPITGLVIPARNMFQNLEEGRPVRFREMVADMTAKIESKDGPETGHSYESKKLKKVKTITVGELYKEVRNGKMSDSDAQKYGYAGAQDMLDKVNQIFVDRESQAPFEEKILLLEFTPVKKESWTYFNPAEAPRAAFTYGGKPVPPSQYRDQPEGINDNALKKGGSAAPKFNHG
jgi:hypothetical protein